MQAWKNDQNYIKEKAFTHPLFERGQLQLRAPSKTVGSDDGDFFQKFGKERKNLLNDLFRRSTTKG